MCWERDRSRGGGLLRLGSWVIALRLLVGHLEDCAGYYSLWMACMREMGRSQKMPFLWLTKGFSQGNICNIEDNRFGYRVCSGKVVERPASSDVWNIKIQGKRPSNFRV